MGRGKPQNRKPVARLPRQRQGEKYTLQQLVSVVGVFVIIGLLVVIWAQQLSENKARQELNELEAMIREYKIRHEALEIEVERLQDPDYIEILARQRLGLVKDDEIIFQLED